MLAQPQSAVPFQSGLFQKLLSISLLRTPTSQIDSLPSRRIAREEHVPLSRLAQFTKKKKSKKKYLSLSLSLSFKLVEEKGYPRIEEREVCEVNDCLGGKEKKEKGKRRERGFLLLVLLFSSTRIVCWW